MPTQFRPEAFARLTYWIVERDRIRLAKEAGKPKPWTNDPHLQGWSYCNVLRLHDRVSRYLMDVWYAEGNLLASPAQIAVNAAMARLINWPDSLDQLRAAGVHERYSPTTARRWLQARADHGAKVFTGAYKVSGRPGEKKYDTVIDQCDCVFHGHARLIDPTSMERTSLRLQEIPAIGSFMAGQIVADLRHVYPGTWADKMTWAPLGPGSERGMAWLLGWDGRHEHVVATYGITHATFLGHIQRLRAELYAVPAVRQVLERVGAEMMDLQNCLCEFDKMMRLVTGTGTPKKRYAGT